MHRDFLHQRGKSPLVAKRFNEAPFLQLDDDFGRNSARHINPVTAQSRQRKIAGMARKFRQIGSSISSRQEVVFEREIGYLRGIDRFSSGAVPHPVRPIHP